MRYALLLPLAALLAAPALAQRTLRPGEPARGALASHDPRLSGGSHYHEYAFQARRGETVELNLESHAFDSYLYLGRGGRDRFHELARDDDGGDGNAARIRYTIPEDGMYLVRASSYRHATGPYTLTLWNGRRGGWDDGPDFPRRGDPWGTWIRPGRPVQDYLSRSDPRLDNGVPYHLYRYEGRRGERITIDLGSTAFDSYLVLGTPGGRHGIRSVLARDDDSGGGLDARIRYTLPHDGEYVIRVNPTTQGYGRYLLEVQSSERRRGDYPRDPRRDDAFLDGRLFGLWELSEDRGHRPGPSTGTLSVRSDGRYEWRRDGRLHRGRLEPYTPARPERGLRYFLLEDGREQYYVFFRADGGPGYIEVVRRSSGRVVARGYRDFRGPVPYRAEDDTGEIRLDLPEDDGR